MEYFAGRAATGFVIPEWLPIPDNVQYNRAVSDLEGIVYNIITQRRRANATGNAPETVRLVLLLYAYIQSSTSVSVCSHHKPLAVSVSLSFLYVYQYEEDLYETHLGWDNIWLEKAVACETAL